MRDSTADEVNHWLDQVDVDPKDARDAAHFRRIVAAAEAVDAASGELEAAVAAAHAAGVSRQAAYQRFGKSDCR